MTLPVALIVAVAANGVIGKDNALPWHIPEDLKWFKRNTMGKPVIMGRKTWDSIGRPLPGRANIVVTRQEGWTAEGAHAAASLSAALALAAELAPEAPELMVIGGAALFAEVLPRCRRIYLTEVRRAYDGDVHFPHFDRTGWREVSRDRQEGDPVRNLPDCDFIVLERVT
ncbi:dihydrofolate reductase [Paramagnetospirillum marisnigri]|uniref:Dihydrofolate reductase n=1 Tax=Paramagnetospirillum marisnigri TaxID=1285242 RepID=A0A178M415_9PROT|nr:dihydrofolate reductase [Paramagnetospirillum marisnigri]OAN43000.1 dihydrofolate reductase [Paramagnetospirillum marisnigri]